MQKTRIASSVRLKWNENMKEYKPYQIFLITSFAVFANFAGKTFTAAFHIPLWFDTFGTFLVSYTLGPFCAAFAAAANVFLYSLYFPHFIAYAYSSVLSAIAVGLLCKRGYMASFLQTMTLSVIITMLCVISESTLNIFIFSGKVNNIWGDGIADYLSSLGVPFWLYTPIAHFYVDFLDKVIVLASLYCFFKFYRNLKSLLPLFLRFHALPMLAIAVFFAAQSSAFSQTIDYNSYVRTIYNGSNSIPCGEANDVVSTTEGILWIGTYAGLYRYNGTEFRLMTDFESIKAVKSLYVDDEGRLFVGTNDSGLSIVLNEKVANVLNEESGLPSDSVRCITKSSNGLYYVGTSEATAIISIVDGLGIKQILTEISDAIRLSSDACDRVAAVTSQGKLFIVQDNRILWDSHDWSEAFTAATFSENGLLYASTESNRLYTFELSGNPLEIVLKTNSRNCAPLQHINSIDFVEGKIFLCADNGIAYIEDSQLHAINTGEFNNSIDKMTTDYQGNLWFSSSRQGLLEMCRSAFEEVYKSAGFKNTVVNSTLKYKGDMYFATDNALSMISGASGEKGENELTAFLENTRVRCLKEDDSGVMWLCTKSKGLLSYDGNEIKRYGDAQNFRVCLPMTAGELAAGSNDGVSIVSGGEIVATLGEKDGFENTMVLCLAELPNGKILAGTDGGGIAVIRRKERRVNEWEIERLISRRDGLSSNVILRIVLDTQREDADGDKEKCGVFVVTSNSICYIDIENVIAGQPDSLFSATILDNFPYYNNFDIVLNDNGDIFVLSSAGIFVVNREELLANKKVDYELLDLRQGLGGSLTGNSWNYLDENKNLYLSCSTGSFRFNLNTYDRREKSYRIQLKSILLDSKRHVVQKDIPFVIPADVESVEIVPEIINYSISDPYISFYLEGVDDRPYIMQQSELGSLFYTQLKSGNYQFHISVLDSKGRYTVEEAVYKISKAYRFYDNWYFKLYALGVFMLAVAWLSWYLTSTLLRRRMEKQEREMQNIRNQVRMGNETIFAIAASVEARDKSTGKHSFRVAEYSVLIAKELGFSGEALEALHKTGLLHDIGKIGVPDSILNKPSRLTDEEYEIMKTHVDIGGEILKDFTLIANVADGAKYHHERYDGSGYPNHLKGEEIPLNARIIGIADAFDAMTANRVYRKALDMDFVREELLRCAGTQFDPGLVNIMIELIDSGKLNVMDIYNQSV